MRLLINDKPEKQLRASSRAAVQTKFVLSGIPYKVTIRKFGKLRAA